MVSEVKKFEEMVRWRVGPRSYGLLPLVKETGVENILGFGWCSGC